MDGILKKLYYGNINPNARSFDDDPDYAEAMGRLTQTEKKLLETLNGAEKELFSDYSETAGEVSCDACAETFVDGFRLGVRFVLDALTNAR